MAAVSAAASLEMQAARLALQLFLSGETRLDSLAQNVQKELVRFLNPGG